MINGARNVKWILLKHFNKAIWRFKAPKSFFFLGNMDLGGLKQLKFSQKNIIIFKLP